MIYFPKNIVKTKEVCYNMSAFDNIKIDTSFGDWIQVFDDESSWTIEDFPYSSGVDGKITYPHCEKCVAVNHCYFKNEKGKKPENLPTELSRSLYILLQYNSANPSMHLAKNSRTIAAPKRTAETIADRFLDFLLFSGFNILEFNIICLNL
jgi:hypothetical protein